MTRCARVGAWLSELDNGDRFQDLLQNPESAFRADEEAYVFGESLPAGLVIMHSIE